MEINYTEDQKEIVRMLSGISQDDSADLLCLPAVDNETGEQALLLGGVFQGDDGCHNFFPFAKCFGLDESPMAMYTLSLEQIEFDEDLIEEEYVDFPVILEDGELSLQVKKEKKSKTGLFSTLTNWIKSALMRK